MTELRGDEMVQVDEKCQQQLVVAIGNTEELNYYRSIDECAKNDSNSLIENGAPAHATYLMVKMFSKAARQIRLFSGSLCLACAKNDIPNKEKVYASDDLIKEAVDFLLVRGGKLNIVLERDIDGELNSHPLIKAIDDIKDKIKGQVRVCKLLPEADIPDRKHFMTMDNQAYRVEYDHKNTKAFANFGDKILACTWVDYFDTTLLPNSKPIYEIK